MKSNSTQQEVRLRFVKATERLPTETNLFNIKYGVAPKLGWYNNEEKQFYGDVLEKYPLDNNAVQWLEELPSSQRVSVEPEGISHIKELPEVAELDGYINSLVHGTGILNYKLLQNLLWKTVEAIQKVYHSQFKTPSPVSELKQKFAEHLGLKPGEELNTTDAYAVEWTVKELNKKL